MNLRPAAVADAPAITDLYTRAFTATFGHLYSAEDLTAFLAGKTVALFAAELADPAFAAVVAENGPRLLGFLKLGPPTLPGDTPPDSIELHQLYVDEAAKGEGVGPALYDWGIAEARRRGARHMQLSVYVDNARARGFYERRGFAKVGDYHFMVGNHADHDEVMRLAL
jgi:diamine N-acetyltransferase